MKIKSFEIKGLRGIKDSLRINLEGKSLLLHGDNGSGKSSITDSFEWFYRDKIDHLACEEIDKRGGVTALRNVHLSEKDESYFLMNFANSSYDSKKHINQDCVIGQSNNSDEFKKYITDSLNENLILRYADLSAFVLSSKTERLNTFSKVIGLYEIDKVKEALKKGFNYLKTQIKSRNFDNEINRRNGDLLRIFSENITSDEDLIKKINKLLEDLNLEHLNAIHEIDQLTARFKEHDDSPIIQKRSFYQITKNAIHSIADKTKTFYQDYEQYYRVSKEIISEIDNIKKMALEKLLTEGESLLKDKQWDVNKCPLCLADKDLDQLLSEIGTRLTEISAISEKRKRLDEARDTAKQDLQTLKGNIEQIKSNKPAEVSQDNVILKFINKTKMDIEAILNDLGKDAVISEVKQVEDIKLDDDLFNKTISHCDDEVNELGKQIKGNAIIETQEKIVQANHIYKEIKALERAKEAMEKYKSTLENIYNKLIQKQKRELETFLKEYSSEINEYYKTLHPNENVRNIALKTIGDEQELKGLTLEFDFFSERVTPPQKYLSESHLNSLGIAFFLASVKAFNKLNNFFILDDIISSFDSDHRLRLSQLIINKFCDYQVIILTHENTWFEYMKNFVKGKNDWIINALMWTNDKGAYLEPSRTDLRTTIENKLSNNDSDGSGNLMRKYLEKLLKEICENLEVRMKYLSNERNESRMCNELLCELKSKINEQPSKDQFQIIDILIKSILVGNIESHDRSIQASIGDLKKFWEDINALKSLFYCGVCDKPVSVSLSNKNNNRIQCKCGKLAYEWKF